MAKSSFKNRTKYIIRKIEGEKREVKVHLKEEKVKAVNKGSN